MRWPGRYQRPLFVALVTLVPYRRVGPRPGLIANRGCQRQTRRLQLPAPALCSNALQWRRLSVSTCCKVRLTGDQSNPPAVPACRGLDRVAANPGIHVHASTCARGPAHAKFATYTSTAAMHASHTISVDSSDNATNSLARKVELLAKRNVCELQLRSSVHYYGAKK